MEMIFTIGSNTGKKESWFLSKAVNKILRNPTVTSLCEYTCNLGKLDRIQTEKCSRFFKGQEKCAASFGKLLERFPSSKAVYTQNIPVVKQFLLLK